MSADLASSAAFGVRVGSGSSLAAHAVPVGQGRSGRRFHALRDKVYRRDTLAKFFDELGPDRAAMLTHVSADGAEWIHAVVRDKAPQAVICLDPFYAEVRIMPMWRGLVLVAAVTTPVRSA